MNKGKIINKLNQINYFYSNLKFGITSKELINFNLVSKIKRIPKSNQSFSKQTKYQLKQIHQLIYTNAFKALISNNSNKYNVSLVINTIINIYHNISPKIFMINTYLNTTINNPYIEDLYRFPHMRSRLHRLLSNYYRIKKGNDGEKYTYNTNLFEGDPIISDINFPDKYSKYFHSSRPNAQIDLTMINKWGIFLLEVKHYSAPVFEIGHNGQIITKDWKGHKDYRMNIVEQITRHETAMRHFLKDHHIYNINVQSIIICANKYAKVKSFCPNTHIFFPQTFYHGFIEDPRNHQDYKPLNKSQIKLIYKFLRKYSGHGELFQELIFKKDFVKSFRKLINYEREINSIYKLASHVKDEQND